MEYCYLIRFKPTNQFYIGSKTSKDADPEAFWNENHIKPYFTSSKTVKNYIDLYGKDSFVVEEIILFEHGGALAYESKILDAIDFSIQNDWLNKNSNCNRRPDNTKDMKWVNNGIKEFYINSNVVLPTGVNYGRLKTGKIRNKRKNKLIHMYDPSSNKNVYIAEGKEEYYTDKGYLRGQTNGAALRSWYNDGVNNIYLKDDEVTDGLVKGRIMENTQLTIITDPRGESFPSRKSYEQYILSKTGYKMKFGDIARAYLENKAIKINKSSYSKRSRLFEFYNLSEIDVIGKDWSQLGWSFKKNL